MLTTIAELMGSNNFSPQNNQVVPNSSSVQACPQPNGQPVNNPNIPLQVK